MGVELKMRLRKDLKDLKRERLPVKKNEIRDMN